jgi:hypothetical protein
MDGVGAGVEGGEYLEEGFHGLQAAYHAWD